jgi:hypothetical protein
MKREEEEGGDAQRVERLEPHWRGEWVDIGWFINEKAILISQSPPIVIASQ